MNAIRELLFAKCTIIDYALSRVMISFEGKSKVTQHKIARDINNNKDIENDLNVFDLIQGYCADLTAVGDSPSGVDAVTDDLDNPVGTVQDKCTFCGAPGHSESECRKKKNKDKEYTYCGEKYHTADKCFQKKRDQRKAKSTQVTDTPQDAASAAPVAPSPEPLASMLSPVNAINAAQPIAQPTAQPTAPYGRPNISQADLVTLLKQLGQHSINAVNHTTSVSGSAGERNQRERYIY